MNKMIKYLLYNLCITFLIVIFLVKMNSFNIISYIFGSIDVLITYHFYNRCINENIK